MFIVFSHGFLYFPNIRCDFFISDSFIWVFFSSLLGEFVQRFVNFVYLFKEPALGFIFSFVFGSSISLISFQIFMICFLLLTLGFVYSSFSNYFRYWVKLSI